MDPYGTHSQPLIPTASGFAERAEQMGRLMAGFNDMMLPLYDAADGVRAQMRQRGYTEEAAEAAAMIYLQNGINALWQGGSQ